MNLISYKLSVLVGFTTVSALTIWIVRRLINRKKNVSIPKMKLYWFDGYRSKRCEWLLAELGAQDAVEMIQMNPADPDQEKLAEYRKLHPHGTVPLLEVEGRPAIIESGAICLYLAHVFQYHVPDDERAAYYNWVVYSVATLDESMETLYNQWALTEPADQDADRIDAAVRKFQTFCRYLTSALHDREFLCGNRLSAADCVLGYNLWWATVMRGGALLHDHPVILQYYNRLRRRSAFQRTFPDS